MSDTISSTLLARYFDGTATLEEREAVEAWVGDDPARQAALQEWRVVWRADVERLGAPYDGDAAWARLSRRVGLLTLVRGRHPIRRVPLAPLAPPVARRATIVRWAAAAAIALLAGAGAWRALGSRESQIERAPAAVASAAREYTTPRGQRGIVRLPDGSEVMLNVASRLIVPVTFGAAGQPRAVQLDGQGYFTVVHDETRPFIVRTARGITRDVGTRFDVRSYPGDPEERVAVTEGEVAMRGIETAVEVALRAGQVAAITPSGQVALLRDADVDRQLAWTRGRLELDGVTLAEAARRLGRWYDLDVRVADDELAQRRVVGSYRDEPVSQILSIIAVAVGARYELRGRSATFLTRAGAP